MPKPEEQENERRQEAKAEQTADAQRALGRFFEGFSWLVARMRTIMIMRLSSADTPHALVMLSFGPATADQLSNIFFGMCKMQLGLDGIELDKNEAAVALKLHQEVRDAITKRNHLAHGDMFVGFSEADADAIDPPKLFRTLPARKHGALREEIISADALDKQSQSMRELERCVMEYGEICLGYFNRASEALGRERLAVRDMLVIEDRKVKRNGPKAPSVFRA